jgi:S1-C subfamily serine protease
MFIIPFDQVFWISLIHYPNLDRPYKWGVGVSIKDKPDVNMRVATRDDAERLAEAIYSLATARGLKMQTPFLGVSMLDLTPQQAAAANLAPGVGQLIVFVDKESPADEAGMQPLDIITEIEGTVITSSVIYENAAAAAKAAGKNPITMKYLRMGTNAAGQQVFNTGTFNVKLK